MEQHIELVEAESHHIEQVQGWFEDQHALTSWGGPGLVYGLNASEFALQIKLDELPSYALTDAKGELYGFGQFYVRLNRHHLGRLAIAPKHRGKGLSKKLVVGLCGIAEEVQKAKGFSLFVLEHNKLALTAYLRLGFRIFDYPEEIPGGLDDCLYMVK